MKILIVNEVRRSEPVVHNRRPLCWLRQVQQEAGQLLVIVWILSFINAKGSRKLAVAFLCTKCVFFVYLTRSSAVAERPRDASCLSVVSFNSTITRVHYSIIELLFRLHIYHCVQLNAALLSWCNIDSSCHKHFVVRLPWTTNSAAYCYQRRVSPTCHCPEEPCWWRSQRWQRAMKSVTGQNSDFFHIPPAFDAPVRASRRNIVMPFDVGKLEWCGYLNPMVWKICRYVYSFRQNTRTWRDRRTDGHRTTAQTALMHSIARQKCLATTLMVINKLTWCCSVLSTTQRQLIVYSSVRRKWRHWHAHLRSRTDQDHCLRCRRV